MKKYLKLLLVPIFFCCDHIEDERIWSQSDKYIGHYKINFEKSKMGKYLKPEFSNLELIIRADTTFEFSKEVPFLTERFGKWKMAGGDVSEHCDLYYSNGAYDQILRESENEIVIKSPRGKFNIEGVEALYFLKHK